MIILLSLILGAVLGAVRARRRKGSRLDLAQWAAVHAILFGLFGVVLTVAIARLL